MRPESRRAGAAGWGRASTDMGVGPFLFDPGESEGAVGNAFSRGPWTRPWRPVVQGGGPRP